VQRYREKKKKESLASTEARSSAQPQPSTSSPATEFSTPVASTESLKKKKGRKKIASNRSAAQRRLKKALLENKKLQRQVWRQKKKIQKLRDKKELTPRSKVRKLLRGKNVDPKIRRRLEFGEVLQKQITEAMKTRSWKVKKVFHQIFSGSLVKHYKMQRYVHGMLSKKCLRKARKAKDKDPLECARATKQKHVSNIEQLKNFFERDDVSTVSPDAKGFVVQFKKGKVKKRKRFLQGTLPDLYKKYSESVPKPLSFSLFCQFKPFYVVKKSLKERNTCLCQLCENTLLLVKALNKAKLITEATSFDMIRSLCCKDRTENCIRRICEKCNDRDIVYLSCDNPMDIIKYKQWRSVNETKQDSKTGIEKTIKRTIIVDQTKTAEDLKLELNHQVKKYMDHHFRESHQNSTLKEARSTLNEEDLFILMDFSQNYTCKYSREVQSHFYGGSKEEITLHTGVVYYPGEEKLSFCTMSESPRHDPPAIIAHLTPVLKKSLRPKTKRLHFKSDSPVTQYRNKAMFYLVSKILPKTFPQIESIIYNFSEAGHGKDSADAIGGCAKNTLDLAVANGQDVSCFNEAFLLLKQKCEKIFVEKIDESSIVEIDKNVPESLVAFQGTLQMHQYTWKKEDGNRLFMNSVSCYQCPPGEQCKHFAMENSPWVTDRNAEKSPNIISAGGPPSRDCSSSSQLDSLPKMQFKKGDWVVVVFGKFWYPGKCQPSCLNQVNFLTRILSFLLSFQVLWKKQTRSLRR